MSLSQPEFLILHTEGDLNTQFSQISPRIGHNWHHSRCPMDAVGSRAEPQVGKAVSDEWRGIRQAELRYPEAGLNISPRSCA